MFRSAPFASYPLIPAKAGIQSHWFRLFDALLWVPAFAGTSGDSI